MPWDTLGSLNLTSLHIGANMLEVGMPLGELIESVVLRRWPTIGSLGLQSLRIQGKIAVPAPCAAVSAWRAHGLPTSQRCHFTVRNLEQVTSRRVLAG